MSDFRLVAGRLIAADKNAWRRPGMISLAIRTLETMASDHQEDELLQIEIQHLIKRLYAASKQPPLEQRA